MKEENKPLLKEVNLEDLQKQIIALQLENKNLKNKVSIYRQFYKKIKNFITPVAFNAEKPFWYPTSNGTTSKRICTSGLRSATEQCTKDLNSLDDPQ